MSLLVLLNILLIVAGPFAVVAPFFAIAQRAGSPARSIARRRPRLSMPRLAVA